MPRRLVDRATAAVICVVCVGAAAVAPAAHAKQPPRRASLVVRIKGLPPGQVPNVTVRGPGATHRRARRATLTLRGLRPGTYSVSARRVRIARAYRGVRKGATAWPTTKVRSVRLRAGKASTVIITYGSVINPGVRALADDPIAVRGPANAPTGITLRRSAARGIARGTVLTSRPTKTLPVGLLHRVISVERSSTRVTVGLRPAAVTDIAPKLTYDGEPGMALIRATPNVWKATLLPTKACGVGFGGLVNGSVQIANFHPRIDIDATPWGGPIHADVTASLRLTVGYQATLSQLLDCELEADTLTLIGVIPVGPVPVPVYLTVPLKGTFEVQAATAISRTIAWDTTVGMRARRQGVALVPQMVFQHGPAQATSTSKDVSAYKVGVGIGVQVGVGVPKVANVHVDVGSDLAFTRAVDRCDLDWRIGTFSAGGRVGPLKVKSPTLAATTVHVWDGCHDGPLPVRPPTGPALYYFRGQAIDATSLATGAETKLLDTPGRYGGLTASADHLYWIGGGNDADTVWMAGRDGSNPHQIISGLTYADSLVVAGGHLYVNDRAHGISRADLDGSNFQSNFIAAPPQVPGDGSAQDVAEGLAADESHIYFSRCFEDSIGRANLDGSGIDTAFVQLPSPECPQGIAVNHSSIYWGHLGGGFGSSDVAAIGRADLDGSGADTAWYVTYDELGPFDFAADDQHVYWTHSVPTAGGPSYIGRLNVDGTGLISQYISGSGYGGDSFVASVALGP